MGLIKRAILRPIYRGLFERPIWWFLGKVKAFFFAETSERLLDIERRLTALEQSPGSDELFRRIEASNAAHWDAIEQLLIGMFLQPRMIEAEEAGAAQHQPDSRSN